MAIHIRRRKFIVAAGAAAAVWPLAARAQQGARVLHVSSVGMQPRDAAIHIAFRKRMAELGYRPDGCFARRSRHIFGECRGTTDLRIVSARPHYFCG